ARYKGLSEATSTAAVRITQTEHSGEGVGMAGDWLKFEVNTPEKPEVLAITIELGWDDPELTVGKLLRVWRWFDQHTECGNATSVTPALLDRSVGVTGFCQAMANVGWLTISVDGISLPNFERHNGATAKKRIVTAKRVAKHKANAKGNDEGNAASVTAALPREDIDIDINNPPNPPAGGESPAKPKRERKPRIQLKTFIENCRAAGESAISGYRPLLEYVEATGLPMEFVQLAWDQFKRQFGTGGKDEARLQADWRRHFQNYVENNYMRLWYAKVGEGGNEYFLTTQGLQAQALQANREGVAA